MAFPGVTLTANKTDTTPAANAKVAWRRSNSHTILEMVKRYQPRPDHRPGTSPALHHGQAIMRKRFRQNVLHRRRQVQTYDLYAKATKIHTRVVTRIVSQRAP